MGAVLWEEAICTAGGDRVLFERHGHVKEHGHEQGYKQVHEHVFVHGHGHEHRS